MGCKSVASVNHANLNECNLRFDTCHCHGPRMWPPFDGHSVIRRLHDVVYIQNQSAQKNIISIRKLISQEEG